MADVQKIGLIFNLTNLTIYFLVGIAAFIKIFATGGFAIVVSQIYVIAACVALFSLELHRPLLAEEYFKFIQTYRGRGITFIFIGVLVFDPQSSNSFQTIAGAICVTMGAVYVLLSFVPNVPDLNGISVNVGMANRPDMERGPVALPSDGPAAGGPSYQQSVAGK